MAKEEKEHKITILINQRPYEAPKPAMTGLEIKELGGGPMDMIMGKHTKKGGCYDTQETGRVS